MSVGVQDKQPSRRNFLKLAVVAAGTAAAGWGAYGFYKTLQSAAPATSQDNRQLIKPLPPLTNYEKMAHLLRRASFGATPEEIEQRLANGLDATIDWLVNYEKVDDPFEDIASKLSPDRNVRQFADIQSWWLKRMVETRRPLQEKMALFWHNHFATSIEKVRFPLFMYQQNMLFRKYALGNFREILLEISKDPAMLIWLDSNSNRKGAPNENYGRELMELFTLSFGNYTEQDVKEAARAFTGWYLNREGQFFFNAAQHDNGIKTFLGHTGNLNGEDIIDILAKHDATAHYISKKLFSFFAYPEPESSVVDHFAQIYLKSNYSIKAVVEAILRSDEFYSDRAFFAQVKDPTQFMVGSLRLLGGTTKTNNAVGAMRRMGQSLFDPPNVKGWDGGLVWITTTTLFERFNFAPLIETSTTDAASKFNPVETIKQKNLFTAEKIVDYYLRLLVQDKVSDETRGALIEYLGSTDLKSAEAKIVEAKVRGLIRLVMAIPDYQLV